MTCKICGKKLPEGSTTCKYCGTSLQPKEPAKSGKRRYSKKALARRRLIDMILIVIALLLIAAVVIGISYSTKQAGKVNEDELLEADGPEAPEPEAPIIPDEEKEEEKEKPIISVRGEEKDEEDEEKLPEAATLEETETEEPEEEPETEQESETPPAVTAPSGNYTVSINRTEVTASLDHYRELSMSVNETLPAGVTVKSVVWTSSNPAVVRAEDGKAWGVSIGEATVTGTLTLSDGQSYTKSCVVTVVEKQVVSNADYVLPDSSTRLYSNSELKSLTDAQLRIARNEIYARHGRKFNDSALQQYFDGKSWYKGTIAPDAFDISVLNSVERDNLYAIMAVENAR